MSDVLQKPVICIAGVSSGTGKTTLTLGLLSALRQRGMAVQPFKCGPDYIDPGFHLEASGVPSRNLDTWMMGRSGVRESYQRAMSTADCGVVEGVMGMFDGASSGSLEGSTADIAKELGLPVVLVVNARGMARSIAPLIMGYTHFEPSLNVIGVIANNVGSENHARILAESLQAAQLPELLGYLPRNPDWQLPERHLGLVPTAENAKRDEWYESLAEAVEECIDLDRLLALANTNVPVPSVPTDSPPSVARLGVAEDEAFHFYYEDNLDLLRSEGVELIPFSPIHDPALPDDIDGLYIGGGFPEMFAEQLASNSAMRSAIRNFSEQGKFVYAECGGLMYLSQSLQDADGNLHEMCGILPCETKMEGRLRRLGYREVRAPAESPFGPAGMLCRGHEFHWSSDGEQSEATPAWEARGLRGNTEWQSTGYQINDTWASYVHLHFGYNPQMVKHLVCHLAGKPTSLTAEDTATNVPVGLSAAKHDIHGGNPTAIATNLGLVSDRPPQYDFSVNLNPLGSPNAVEDILLSESLDWHNYPSAAPTAAEASLAAAHNVSLDQVVVGNGATELFGLVLEGLRVRSAVWLAPSYSGYREACETLNIPVAPVFSPDEIPLNTDLVFIGNPTNPSGAILTCGQLLEIIATRPNPYFVIDESFMDFVVNDSAYSLMGADNLDKVIIVKSLTKAFSIAGLRLGMAVTTPVIAGKMRQCRLPWTVNAAAQKIACKLYDDPEFLQTTKQTVAELRTEFSNWLAGIDGLEPQPSAVNFILVKVTGTTAPELQGKLLEKGFFIRSCDSFAGLDDSYVRLAVCNREDNMRLVNALVDIFGGDQLEIPESTPAVMVVGTMSNSGKSALASALCRYFARRNVAVTPFKAQNMALNSFVTKEGGEMGRAQVVQAQAARIQPHCDMNPVLLKPSGDMNSQVIVDGKPLGNTNARSYYEERNSLRAYAHAAYDRLCERFDLIVLEGAGSPAEINIQKRDIVNMNMAEYAKANVILVADIDRGGVFASIYGTIKLIPPRQRQLVKGVIINKFRGDVTLLDSGIKKIEELTGIPVLGVMPYIKDLQLEEEDSLGLEGRHRGKEDSLLDIAVVRLPRISNYTDFFVFDAIPGISVRYISKASDLGNPDLIILPGSKNTRSDLEWLHGQGWKNELESVAGQVPIVGICGGYQMLGEVVSDPDAVESAAGETAGIGLLPVSTVLAGEKELTQVDGATVDSLPYLKAESSLRGYEIHMGKTQITENDSGALPFSVKSATGEERMVGCRSADGMIFGSYLHGIFDHPDSYRQLINWLCERKDISIDQFDLDRITDSEIGIDQVADCLTEHVDMATIENWLKL